MIILIKLEFQTRVDFVQSNYFSFCLFISEKISSWVSGHQVKCWFGELSWRWTGQSLNYPKASKSEFIWYDGQLRMLKIKTDRLITVSGIPNSNFFYWFKNSTAWVWPHISQLGVSVNVVARKKCEKSVFLTIFGNFVYGFFFWGGGGGQASQEVKIISYESTVYPFLWTWVS